MKNTLIFLSGICLLFMACADPNAPKKSECESGEELFLDQDMEAGFQERQESDYFQFTPLFEGSYFINFDADVSSGRALVEAYDEDRQLVFSEEVDSYETVKMVLGLQTHCIRVQDASDAFADPYTYEVEMYDGVLDEFEPNDKQDQATRIKPFYTEYGALIDNKDKDWFIFTVESDNLDGELYIRTTTDTKGDHIDFTLTDEDGKKIEAVSSEDQGDGIMKYELPFFDKGATYYLKFENNTENRATYAFEVE